MGRVLSRRGPVEPGRWTAARPGLRDALAAALSRVAPDLTGEAFEREAAWQAAEVRFSDRAPGLVAWGTMPLGRLLRDRMAEAQNWRCCWCGRAMDPAAADALARPTFEHVVPLRDGGADHPDNLAIACCACNHERSKAGP